MIIVEYKEAARNKVVEELEKAKKYGKKTKLALCELEDAIYDCLEIEDEEFGDHAFEGEYDEDGEHELGMRRGSRRRNMRYHDEDMYDMERRHRSMGMRRSRSGRYAY